MSLNISNGQALAVGDAYPSSSTLYTNNEPEINIKQTTFSSITVESGGDVTIFSGGIVSGLVIESGGQATLDPGGFFGGLAENVTVSIGGLLGVYGSGVVQSVTISGGDEYISGSALTGNSGGEIYASSDDSNLVGATISGGEYFGEQNVGFNGVAKTVNISSGGFQDVQSGGSATNVTISVGGEEVIESGGAVSGVTVLRGCFENGI